MSSTEALHHATKGGYHIKASDGMDTGMREPTANIRLDEKRQ